MNKLLALIITLFVINSTALAVEKEIILQPGRQIQLDQNYSDIIDEAVLESRLQHIQGVVSERVNLLTINQFKIPVKDNKFSTGLILHEGKNVLRIVALDRQNNILDTQIVRVLVLKKLLDVPATHWAKEKAQEIATLAALPTTRENNFHGNQLVELCNVAGNVVNVYGYDIPDENSKDPEKLVELARGIGMFDATEVNQDSTFEPMSWLNALSIILNSEGYSPQKYGSTQWTSKTVIPCALANDFISSQVADQINPAQFITKVEMAYLLAKTSYYRKQLVTLYDWDSYLSMDDKIFMAGTI